MILFFFIHKDENNWFEYKYNYYSYKIDDSLRKGLTISVTPIAGDPNIFISLDSENPTEEENEIECSFRGFDYCPIEEDKLENKPIVYIGIGCMRSCEYRLIVLKEE